MIKKYQMVALQSNGGLSWKKLHDKAGDGGESQREVSVKASAIIHPDLKDKFAGLRGYLLDAIGFEMAKGSKPRTKVMDKIKVTKVSISGTEEKPKVVISGKIESPLGSNVALNTPLIPLSGSALGFEAKLQEALEELVDEADKYVVEGKESQLSMGFVDDDKDGDKKKNAA